MKNIFNIFICFAFAINIALMPSFANEKEETEVDYIDGSTELTEVPFAEDSTYEEVEVEKAKG